MRKTRNFSLAMAMTLFWAGTAAAQGQPLPEPGQRSISFGLPGNLGHNTFGFWTMHSEKLNLGLNLGLNLVSNSTDGTTTSKVSNISIGPALRYYAGSLGPVVPFLHGQADIRYGKTDQPDRSSKGFGLASGLGAEWFPTRNISISGTTGLGFSANWVSTSQGGTTIKTSNTGIGTFTSALTIQLYFGGRGAAVASQR